MWGGTKDAYPPFTEPTKGKKSLLQLITTGVMKETEGDRKERKSPLFSHLREGGEVNSSLPKLNPVEGDGERERVRLIWWTWRWLVDAPLRCLASTEWKIKTVSQSNESKEPSELFCLSEQSVGHMFIWAAPQRFNLFVTLRFLRQIKAEKWTGGGKWEQIQVGFFLSESWRLGTFPRIWCLYILAWCCVLWLI